jgi:hypothetical protein
LELIKDYDSGINYHPSKANVVADARSRRSHLNMVATRELSWKNFAKNLRSLTSDGYQIPKSLPWKWIQCWNRIFEKDNLRMPRFKKSKNRLRKIKLQDTMLMIKERYGTRSISVFQK